MTFEEEEWRRRSDVTAEEAILRAKAALHTAYTGETHTGYDVGAEHRDACMAVANAYMRLAELIRAEEDRQDQQVAKAVKTLEERIGDQL